MFPCRSLDPTVVITKRLPARHSERLERERQLGHDHDRRDNVTYHAEVGSNNVCSFNLPLGGNQP